MGTIVNVDFIRSLAYNVIVVEVKQKLYLQGEK